MELEFAIQSRCSIRTFQAKPLKTNIIKDIISKAVMAPSASNKQAWKFIIVDDPILQKSICRKYGSRLITSSPAGILVLYRNDVSQNFLMYKDHIQSASAVIQNILLLAHDRELGACWVCDLPPQKYIRKILKIPRCYDVIAYVALGHTKEYLSDHTLQHYNNNREHAISRKRKYTLEQIISYNTFDHVDNKDAMKFIYLRAFLFYLYKCIRNKTMRRWLWKIITA